MPAVPLVRPLLLRTLDDAGAPRKVTWLELFFDLVFVAAVSQVAAPLSEGFSADGLLRFGVLFVLVWWAWLGHTIFATRFDTDDLLQRGLTLLQMFVVAVMGINAGEALHSRESAGFAAAYAILRLVLVAQYLRARRLAHTRPLSSLYLAGCGCAALLWLLSAFVPPPTRFILWGAALLVDVTTPLVAERHSPRVPPDASHLPERFGLFTIILLGESVLAVMQGMRSQDTWSLGAAVAALASLALLFLLWWWYFDHARAAEERPVRCRADAVRLRVWGYAHLPLYLGVALTGVGLEHLIRIAGGGSPVHAAEAFILSSAVALLMTALIVIEAAGTRERPANRRRCIKGLAVASLTVLAGLAGALVPPVVLTLALLALVLAQVSPAFRAAGDRLAGPLVNASSPASRSVIG